MPASVSYRINGKYDATAMNKAKGGISTLEQSAKKLTSSLKGVAIGALSFTAINKALKDCSATFLTNDKVQNQAMKSLQNNTKMTASAIKSLVKEVDGMAGYFQGSDLVNATNIISKYVGNPEDIKKTLQAARDMAADGVMPLDQAAKALGQSLNGNVNSLQRMYPELKKLTDEELKNGKAVEYLAQKYKGVEEAMSGTFSGRKALFGNTIDALKDSIGGIVQSLSFITHGKLIEPLNKATSWINDNKVSVINFFTNLPAIATTVLTSIKNITLRLLNPVVINGIFNEIAVSMVKTYTLAIQKIVGVTELAMSHISFTSLAKDLYNSIMNAFIDITNSPVFKAFEKINPLFKAVALAVKGAGAVGKAVGGANENRLKEELDAFRKDIKTTFTESKDDFGNIWKESFSAITSQFADITGQTQEDIAKILKKELPKDLVNALESSYLDNGNENEGNEPKEKDMSVFSGVTGLLGDLGNAIQSVITSAGWLGALLQLISALISDLKEKSTAVSNFLSMFSVLADKINDDNVISFTDRVLVPLMKAVENIGVIISAVVGPVLQKLAPFLEGFAKAIEAIVNVMATVVTGLYNLYVDIHNAIPFNSKMSRKSYSDIWDNSSQTSSSSSAAGSVASGTAASYTAARDVYVTINFSNSYVNGDSREIAISLYNEIKSAKRLGLIG